VLADSGDALGMDMGEAAIIPVASAMELFDLSGLFRVLVQVRPNADREQVQSAIEDEMAERHHGKPDITVITPDALLAAFDDILRVLTLGVGAIGAISLVVAGILMMNVTVINVRQRTHEIGLLKALGGTPRQIRRIFLLEAALAALGGGLIGFGVAGLVLAAALKTWPTIPFAVPAWAVLAALGLALVIGTGFAAIPARQAARYAPMDALRTRV
jgi:putative ABC transport system permease protein